jgi:hypothetical protein
MRVRRIFATAFLEGAVVVKEVLSQALCVCLLAAAGDVLTQQQ